MVIKDSTSGSWYLSGESMASDMLESFCLSEWPPFLLMHGVAFCSQAEHIAKPAANLPLEDHTNFRGTHYEEKEEYRRRDVEQPHDMGNQPDNPGREE